MFGFFKRRKSPASFWTWLAANTPRIQSSREDVSNVAAELSKTFESSFPDLVWEVSPAKTGPWTFTISADGIYKRFDQVRAAIAAAPAIPGWNIQAFRQRGSLDVSIDLNGQTLSCEDIWCQVAAAGHRVNLTLHIRGLTPDPNDPRLGAAVVLLDNALGEHDAVTRIAHLHNAPLSPNPTPSPTFFPLSNLPSYIDHLCIPSSAIGSNN